METPEFGPSLRLPISPCRLGSGTLRRAGREAVSDKPGTSGNGDNGWRGAALVRRMRSCNVPHGAFATKTRVKQAAPGNYPALLLAKVIDSLLPIELRRLG
jgi:hypothetical protein